MSYPLYILFGVLPSVIWLLFYLRKDVHPESNRMILKIFFYGMLATIPAIFLELILLRMEIDIGLIYKLNLPEVIRTSINAFSILFFFLGVAVIEEVIKYLVVKTTVINDPEFDEPLDAMLYMIIAALGFAALENVLFFFNLERFPSLEKIFALSAFRFIGATFLHALASGTIGYFLALSFFTPKNKTKFLAAGFSTAIVLHTLYNFSIMVIEGWGKIILPLMTLLILASFVSLGFKNLKKLKGLCIIP